jgi:RNA polymerase sigma-70 factor (ECF subfamily)
MNRSSPLNLERLFQAYQQELIARLQRIVGCWHTAADLVQDTYVRLLRIKDPQEITHPRAFLHRTATNLALDYLRQQKHRTSMVASFDDAAAVPSQAPTASQSVYDKQRFAAFQAAFDTLPFHAKEVLVLRRIHGCTHHEIAQRLGLTKRQVENHLAKALYHCQRALPDTSTP